MSNHFHAILQADAAKLSIFFAKLKIQLGRYHKKKYGSSPAPRWEFKVFPIPDRRAFCQEAAYILRNPYKARIDSPVTYPWSSAQAYFSRRDSQGTRVAEMTFEEKLGRLHTRAQLPGKMLVSPDGKILPESFIETGFVEKMFGGSPIMYFDLLKKWNLEDIVNSSHGDSISEPYKDEEIAKGILNFCRDIFCVSSPEEMDERALVRLARKVQDRYGASRSQLLRLLPMDDYLLDRI